MGDCYVLHLLFPIFEYLMDELSPSIFVGFFVNHIYYLKQFREHQTEEKTVFLLSIFLFFFFFVLTSTYNISTGNACRGWMGHPNTIPKRPCSTCNSNHSLACWNKWGISLSFTVLRCVSLLIIFLNNQKICLVMALLVVITQIRSLSKNSVSLFSSPV